VAEVSLALVLLVGAGLMIRSFMRLQSVETGFKAENVLTMRAQLPRKNYSEPHQIVDFFKRAQERIAALPGVQAVGAISYLPLTGLASRARLIPVRVLDSEGFGTARDIARGIRWAAEIYQALKTLLHDDGELASARAAAAIGLAPVPRRPP
jgi:hypothetical protein